MLKKCSGHSLGILQHRGQPNTGSLKYFSSYTTTFSSDNEFFLRTGHCYLGKGINILDDLFPFKFPISLFKHYMTT
jgi:hypothetical protein